MVHSSPISESILSRSNIRYLWAFAFGGLLLLLLAVYVPAYNWAFIGDDYVQFGYIRELVEEPATFFRAFDPFWSTWYYRPLQNLWLLAVRLLFGLNPFPYYYLQSLGHLLVTTLAYGLARHLQLGRWTALGAAALFALNANHQDVVSWISSVATILVTGFSFAAILAYLRGDGAARSRAWVPVFGFTLLALFSHEIGVLLPPFLLLLTLAQRKRRGGTWVMMAVLVGAAVALAAMHLLRPNLTLAVQETPAGAYVDGQQLLQYGAILLGRWTLLVRTAAGTRLLNLWLGSPAVALLPLGAVLATGWVGYQIVAGRGKGCASPAQRAAYPLAWSILHLGFTYGALWVQAPELLAGRHHYAAWAGVALALAVATGAALERIEGGTAAQRLGPALLAGGLLIFLVIHLTQVKEVEASWLARAEEVAEVEAQMKEIVPALTPASAVYAHSFVLKPSFAPYAAATWYGETGIDGGSLNRLREARAVGPETYLFGYAEEEGRLYELLPALHAYEETLLLWPEGNSPRVAGPPGAERLAIAAPAEDWHTVAVTATVPPGTGFYTAFHGPPGSRYRVRALADGAERLIAEGTVGRDGSEWEIVTRALPGYRTKQTTFLLESAGGGAWTIPRLVREKREGDN